MMKKISKWTALMLAMMLVLLCPVEALAAENRKGSFETVFINPLYEDVVSEQDLESCRRPLLYADAKEVQYLTTVEDAAEAMREAMKQRQESIAIPVRTDLTSQDDLVGLMHEINDFALVHTGEPTEGDYLMWQYGGWKGGAEYYESGGWTYITYTYTLTYYTTAEEEAVVDAAVEDLLANLDIAEADEYARIRSVYDYICANVVYDYDHLDDPGYKHQFTAYAALIDGTSVCQGYAVLLYRLALELDVDCRLIAGTGGGEPHGWNIVGLGDRYYNADSTWDAETTDYDYFLVREENFSGHARDDAYDSDAFHQVYPMTTVNYDNCTHSFGEDIIIQASDCTDTGLSRSYCTGCGAAALSTVAAAGHNWTTVVQEPTCTAQGYTARVCENCGEETEREYTEKTPHNYVDGICTVCGDGSVNRISGRDRCATAILVAEAMREAMGRDTFDTIILASGDNFADALSGSYLANVKQAPILLHRASALEKNLDYIREYLSEDGMVYILGGSAAVPNDVEAALKEKDIAATRLAGKSRFDTNLEILREAGTDDQEILVCTGHSFADSLSASASGRPILMVNNKTGKLTDAQASWLGEQSRRSFCIIGGEGAVSKGLADVLGAYGSVERVGGSTRYETSVKVAQRYFAAPEAAVLAYAFNFPDGLCGGPLAYAMDAPLLLTATGKTEAAAAYAAERGIARGVVLGGESLISDNAAEDIFG